MYVSNKTLKTIVRDTLKGKGYNELLEEKRRPDLIFFDISSIAPFYFEDFNDSKDTKLLDTMSQEQRNQWFKNLFGA